MKSFQSVLIVGCGNMGGAMLAGWLASGLAPSIFTIVDPALQEAPAGVALLRELPDADFDAIMLGVKPQLFDAVAPDIERLAGERTVILSIMAGVELVSLAARFPRAAGHIRIMPNLAAALGKSPLGLAGQHVSDSAKHAVEDLLRPLGSGEWIDESLFDLVTALAGSGPAFVYRFIDALASGAESLGMPRAQADRLALAMVEGASALAAASDVTPAELARRVTSPGGTTAAGLKVLDEGHALAELVEATLRAARDRGAEMAAAARASMPEGHKT
ncbi:pyrroline-5-carboxylate reductase [Croceicoccus estronivorus]|uniref:pyrroline-5-carboxylate reductase n=1 Tax=Croceicoccus estronivorus TaxID=1172626 RepID=UPI00082F8E6A|nr:pyrroline-5-carboxylate reductase [Croceicoccus estronivorus]OCC25193.1 pyrroline-5-carboxylate reductase [Croceicoccus estronivorus]